MSPKGDKNGQNVTAKQFKAIESLLETGSITQAAEAAGVTRKTVHEWLKQDHFSTALNEAQSDVIQALTCDMVRIGRKAAATVETALDSKSSIPTPIKLRAADIALRRLERIRDLSSTNRKNQAD